MLKSAKLVSPLETLELRPEPRGLPERCLNADDLIAFGRCPARWLRSEDTDDPLLERGPKLTEWLAFAPEPATKFFVKRPDTYEALVLRCPKCNSRAPAKVCRKCGSTRRNVVELRPWSSAATVCAEWSAKHEEQGRRIIPTTQWDLCQMAVEQMLHDPAILDLAPQSSALPHLVGLWRDEDTRLEFPLEARLTLLPRDGTPLDNCAVSYTEVRNADPLAWGHTLACSGLLIHAALALLLVNEATKGCRNQFLWLVVERDAPRLVCRRRLAPEVLDAGRAALFGLLSAYARCLALRRWPSFEEPDTNCLAAWTETHLEPWLGATASASGGFFAPDATLAMTERETAHAKA